MKIRTKVITSLAIVMVCLMSLTNAQAANRKTLDSRQKAIIPIAAFTATGNLPKLKTALNAGLDAGLTVNEIKEILIHLYAYAGFPRALNGINTFNAVMDQRQAQGIKDTIGKEATAVPADFDPNTYGHQVRNALVGRDISKRTSGYPVFTPVIDKFLVEHLFADIFYRDVLTHQDRELVTISVLAAMTGTEPQLKGHLNIAMSQGVSKEQMADFVTVLTTQVGADSAERAAQKLDELGTGISAVVNKALKVTKNGQGTKAPEDYFTGHATVSSRFTEEGQDSYRGGIVNFENGARTAWHKHPVGQTLIVISGRGLVQSEGEPVKDIAPGDVVWIPANEKHWHGAAPDSAMSHVAISAPQNGSTVAWMEHVTDGQYAR